MTVLLKLQHPHCSEILLIWTSQGLHKHLNYPNVEVRNGIQENYGTLSALPVGNAVASKKCGWFYIKSYCSFHHCCPSSSFLLCISWDYELWLVALLFSCYSETSLVRPPLIRKFAFSDRSRQTYVYFIGSKLSLIRTKFGGSVVKFGLYNRWSFFRCYVVDRSCSVPAMSLIRWALTFPFSLLWEYPFPLVARATSSSHVMTNKAGCLR